MNARELAALPEDGCRRELHGGLLVAEPWPAPRHGQVQARLISLLEAHVRVRGLGQVLVDVGFLLSENPDTMLVPDVAFVSQARWRAVADKNWLFPGVPDLAVEILSPSNRASEMRAKVAAYLAAGTRLVWVIDPERRRLSSFGPGRSVRSFRAGDSVDGDGVVDGLTLDLDTLLED